MQECVQIHTANPAIVATLLPPQHDGNGSDQISYNTDYRDRIGRDFNVLIASSHPGSLPPAQIALHINPTSSLSLTSMQHRIQYAHRYVVITTNASTAKQLRGSVEKENHVIAALRQMTALRFQWPHAAQSTWNVEAEVEAEVPVKAAPEPVVVADEGETDEFDISLFPDDDDLFDEYDDDSGRRRNSQQVAKAGSMSVDDSHPPKAEHTVTRSPQVGVLYSSSAKTVEVPLKSETSRPSTFSSRYEDPSPQPRNTRERPGLLGIIVITGSNPSQTHSSSAAQTAMVTLNVEIAPGA
jgi:hypothetical protein